MFARVELASLLESDPAHRSGRPYVARTRVSVDRIGSLYGEGFGAAVIADRLDLTLSQVFAALAYYLANRETIDAEIVAEDDETLRVAAQWTAVNRRS